MPEVGQSAFNRYTDELCGTFCLCLFLWTSETDSELPGLISAFFANERTDSLFYRVQR